MVAWERPTNAEAISAFAQNTMSWGDWPPPGLRFETFNQKKETNFRPGQPMKAQLPER